MIDETDKGGSVHVAVLQIEEIVEEPLEGTSADTAESDTNDITSITSKSEPALKYSFIKNKPYYDARYGQHDMIADIVLFLASDKPL